MMQGDNGSLDMFWTFPPTAKARPDGVRSGCVDFGGCVGEEAYAGCGED